MPTINRYTSHSTLVFRCVSLCADYSQDVEGEYYVVERYESDVEEEKGASGGSGRDARHQVIIRLSEGFLEEIEDVSGKVMYDTQWHE